MPGGDQRDIHAVAIDALAIRHTLRGAGEIRAIARSHDCQRLRRRQHRAMAAPGMVAMAMGDDRAVHRRHRIDKEIARRAIKPGFGRAQQVGEFGHRPETLAAGGMFRYSAGAGAGSLPPPE